MAKGDVIMKFDAQTAAFVQRVQAARQALEAGGNAARQFGETAAHAGDKAGESMEQASEKIVDAMKAFIGIGGAVETVSKVWESELQEMEHRADHLRETMVTLQGALAGRGDVAALPQVRKRLDEIAEGKATHEQTEQLYGGISAALGSRASEKQIEDATAAAVRGLTLGMNQQQAMALGQTYGELSLQARPGTALAAMSDAQKQEIAYTLQRQIPQGMDERTWAFIARGKDPLAALDLVIAAKHGHEEGRALEQVMTESEQDLDPVTVAMLKKKARRRQATAEDLRKLRLAAIAPDDRAAAILADPTLAQPQIQRLIANLEKNAGTFVEDDLAHHTLAAQVAAMAHLRETDPAARAKYIEETGQRQGEKVIETHAAEDMTEDAVFQRMEDQLVSEGESRYRAKANVYWQRFQHWAGVDWRPGGDLSDYERTRQGMLGAAAAAQSKQISDELKKQTAHLAAIAGHVRTRADTKLSRDTEGQR